MVVEMTELLVLQLLQCCQRSVSPCSANPPLTLSCFVVVAMAMCVCVGGYSQHMLLGW